MIAAYTTHTRCPFPPTIALPQLYSVVMVAEGQILVLARSPGGGTASAVLRRMLNVLRDPGRGCVYLVCQDFASSWVSVTFTSKHGC